MVGWFTLAPECIMLSISQSSKNVPTVQFDSPGRSSSQLNWVGQSKGENRKDLERERERENEKEWEIPNFFMDALTKVQKWWNPGKLY